MNTAVALVALVTAAIFFAVFYRGRQAGIPDGQDAAWEAARAGESSEVMRTMLRMARPFSALPQAHPGKETTLYRALHKKLVGSGGAFGGSIEVFMSMQMLALLISTSGIAMALASGTSGMLLGVALLIAVAFAAMPYNRLASAYKDRAAAVLSALPDFAELMLMPVSSGYSILPAVDFTAKRLEGPVAFEARRMLDSVTHRTASEKDAFIDAGERLGGGAAATFFNSLYRSYEDGTQISDNIQSQAEQLRIKVYEDTRAKIKALPNKLVFIMGLHLLPFLFAVVLLPTFMALTAL